MFGFFRLTFLPNPRPLTLSPYPIMFNPLYLSHYNPDLPTLSNHLHSSEHHLTLLLYPHHPLLLIISWSPTHAIVPLSIEHFKTYKPTIPLNNHLPILPLLPRVTNSLTSIKPCLMSSQYYIIKKLGLLFLPYQMLTLSGVNGFSKQNESLMFL